MSFIQRLFPAKTAITSATIRAEIERSEVEITRLHAEISPKLATIATFTDSEHVKVDADIAATKRAITRLDARVGHLTTELPAVIAAEEAAAQAATDEALRTRAEASRKANSVRAKMLLSRYDSLAAEIADILGHLKLIDSERAAVNTALRSNPVAESVENFTDLHRKNPDQIASETREMRPCWVFRYPGSPTDTGETKFQYEAPREEIRQATIGADGKAIPGGTEIHNYYGRELVITPRLEEREIVVGRTYARPGRYEDSLETAVRLPPAFVGPYIWPRS